MIYVSNKEQIKEKLNELLEKEVVFHYHCGHCKDEQVTYNEVVDKDLINHIEKNDGICANYDCSSCGLTEHVIYVSQIYGIEVL